MLSHNNGKTEIMRVLLDYKHPRGVDGYELTSALRFALANSHNDIVQLILDDDA
jgi:hypothetical protein